MINNLPCARFCASFRKFIKQKQNKPVFKLLLIYTLYWWEKMTIVLWALVIEVLLHLSCLSSSSLAKTT